MAVDQVLVADEVPDHVALRHVGAVGHHHDALELRGGGGELLGDRQKVEVDEQEAVGRVVDDVFQLIREEAGIDGVADRTHARHGEIDLVVTVGVPGEGPDPVAGLHAECRERIRQLLHAPMRIGIGPSTERLTISVSP